MTTQKTPPQPQPQPPKTSAAAVDAEEEFSAGAEALPVNGSGPSAEGRSTVTPAWREGRGGRPPKWTVPSVREGIIDGVRLGAPMKFVLQAVRVSPEAFAQWQRQAQLPDAPEELVELFERIGEATGKTVLRNIGQLQAAAQDPKHWRASAWWLEHVHGEDFRKPEAGGSVPQQTTLVVASSEDIRRLQATLAGRVIDARATTAALGAGDVTDEADADDGWDEDDD